MMRQIERERPPNRLVCLGAFEILPHSRSYTALPYTWTQELGEVDVVVPVPKGTRGKDLSVVIQKKKLSVGLKGQEKILDGELCKNVKVDDSTWTLRKLRNSVFTIHADTDVVLQRITNSSLYTWKKSITRNGGRTFSPTIPRSIRRRSNRQIAN